MFIVKITTRNDEEFGVLAESESRDEGAPEIVMSRQIGKPKQFTEDEANRAAKKFAQQAEWYNFIPTEVA